MNPLRAVRWKLLAGLVVVGAAASWLGLPALLDRAISLWAEEELLSRASSGGVSLSLLSGRCTIEDLHIPDPQGGSEPLLAADRLEADLSLADLLRRRVVVEVLRVERPRATLVQDEEGRLNVEETRKEKARREGLDPREVARTARELYGKVEEGRDWVQGIRSFLAHLQAEERLGPERPAGRTPLTELGPRFVVRKLEISRLHVNLDGPSGAPGIRETAVAGQELSSDPARHDEHTGLRLQGLLGREQPAAFWLQARLEPRDGSLRTHLDRAELADLQASHLQPLLGATLPFNLDAGRVAVRATDGWIRTPDAMDVTATILVAGLKVSPKPGVASLGGFPADRLCRALSDAGTFELEVRLTGPPLAPRVDLGDFTERLMRMGAAAFRKEALRRLETRLGPDAVHLLEGGGPAVLPGVLTAEQPPGDEAPGLGKLLPSGDTNPLDLLRGGSENEQEAPAPLKLLERLRRPAGDPDSRPRDR